MATIETGAEKKAPTPPLTDAEKVRAAAGEKAAAAAKAAGADARACKLAYRAAHNAAHAVDGLDHGPKQLIRERALSVLRGEKNGKGAARWGAFYPALADQFGLVSKDEKEALAAK